MFYTYIGQVGGNYQYHVTLKLFKDCNCTQCAELDLSIGMAVFEKGTNVMAWRNDAVARTQIITLNLTSPSPCISNPPPVCYQVGYYEADISVPASPDGYIIAFQRCCRINGINNLNGSSGLGATYTAEIPGTSLLSTAPQNNSARFIGADTVIVCANNPFTYSFAAQDADGDLLGYSFCTAYLGGGQVQNPPNNPNSPTPIPPVAPAYIPVPYQSPPYDALNPMGSGITINPLTGLITGIAPASGIYVVTVCVTETRNGILIATQRKDLQIKVGDCNPLTAQLNPQQTTCDGFVVNFDNDPPTPNPPNTSYFWTFGDPASGLLDTSFLETPTHDYTIAGAGTYNVRLRVSLAGLCIDSADLQVNIFPGFFPGFTSAGGCVTNPFQFTDTTKTNYGVVDNWSWNFGDLTTLADTSHLQNPQWTYSTSGIKTVTLTVRNSKGCVDSKTFDVTVLDKPIITKAFGDTLICIPDAVTLGAAGSGSFSWTPLTNIINANTAAPTVNPIVDTWYVVTLNDNGCINKDSVQVRVVAGVSLMAIGDTTICLTDPVQLNVTSNGLAYLWSPAGTLNNPAIKNPVATPTATNTTYQVRAFIGTCFADDFVTINTAPYPIADAGIPQIVCFNKSAQLNGSHNGSTFSWSPTSYLNNPNILNPVATPPRTTTYILTSFDTRGCPKPGRDTVVITMLPRVRAYAGRDTSVVIGQPLQFLGTGGLNYLWSPATGLTSTNIYNPVGVYNGTVDSIRYKLIVSDIAGCSDSAFVTVKIYKVKPTIFVPTAFTPNNDGKNDLIYPISVGIKKINYFSIYNRWGERVFTTTVDRAGWDGTISGRTQDSGVFVWMVSAIDYIGRPVFLKGTVTLIR